MSDPADNDDIAMLAALGRELASPDLDAPTAERIAERAEADVGRGADPRRFVEPAIAAAVVIPYGIWVVAEVLKIFRH